MYHSSPYGIIYIYVKLCRFCDGLSSSYIFLPLLSRDAINHATESRQGFPMLSPSSPCDNVLLEYMLALELQMRGLIVNIYPVMIGDMKPGNDRLYGNYFKDGCHPTFSKEVVVKSNQRGLEGHLDRLGLGTPMLEDLSVSQTVKEITKNQGLFVEGSIRSCLQRLREHVTDMRKDIDRMAINVKEAESRIAIKRVSRVSAAGQYQDATSIRDHLVDRSSQKVVSGPSQETRFQSNPSGEVEPTNRFDISTVALEMQFDTSSSDAMINLPQSNTVAASSAFVESLPSESVLNLPDIYTNAITDELPANHLQINAISVIVSNSEANTSIAAPEPKPITNPSVLSGSKTFKKSGLFTSLT